jgi:hypothetical protein
LSATECTCVKDVTQTEIYTVEPLVLEPSSLYVGNATEELTMFKSSGIEQILAEMIVARGKTLLYEIRTLISSIWNKK